MSMDSIATLPDETSLIQLIDSVPNGVVAIDTTGRIFLANAEIEKLFGYERAELLGQPIEMLLPERYRDAHVRMRIQYCRHPTRRAMGAGRDLFGLRRDGREIPIEVGLNPLSMANGLAIVASIVDISGRKRLERNFERIVESAPCGMLMFNQAGTIVMANARLAEMFGYPRREVIGKPLNALVPEQPDEQREKRRAEFFAHPSPRTMGGGRDVNGLRKDGTEFPVEIGLNPIESEAGLMALAAVTDIAAYKKMESELRQANADLEEFAYVVSHDLKSPLRAVADLVEWLAREVGQHASSRILHDLSRIDSRIVAMERLIDDLLAYACASEAPGEAVPINPRELIQSVIDFLPHPREINLAIRCEVDEIITYRTPLETVLRNLIGNAIAHHDRTEGTVEISVTAEDGYCCLTVSDDGPGIPENNRQHMFELFRTFAVVGHGIGLAVCKRLVEKHGGRIVLEDNAQGRGATLRFWWPRFARRDAAGEPRAVQQQ
jgi:PAS domain S-box-containing protein